MSADWSSDAVETQTSESAGGGGGGNGDKKKRDHKEEIESLIKRIELTYLDMDNDNSGVPNEGKDPTTNWTKVKSSKSVCKKRTRFSKDVQVVYLKGAKTCVEPLADEADQQKRSYKYRSREWLLEALGFPLQAMQAMRGNPLSPLSSAATLTPTPASRPTSFFQKRRR